MRFHHPPPSAWNSATVSTYCAARARPECVAELRCVTTATRRELTPTDGSCRHGRVRGEVARTALDLRSLRETHKCSASVATACPLGPCWALLWKARSRGCGAASLHPSRSRCCEDRRAIDPSPLPPSSFRTRWSPGSPVAYVKSCCSHDRGTSAGRQGPAPDEEARRQRPSSEAPQDCWRGLTDFDGPLRSCDRQDSRRSPSPGRITPLCRTSR